MTPSDRELIMAEINDNGYGDDVPGALTAVLVQGLRLDRDAEALVSLALYHAYAQGRADAGDQQADENAS